MGIKPNFNQAQIRKAIHSFKQRADISIITTLQYLGESLCNYAKDNITFMPRTGNLQNSIGYVVVKKGIVISSGSFGNLKRLASLAVKNDVLNIDGANQGLEFANRVAKNCHSDYTLIIVAGMNYAAYVEAKGYNVILPAELKAKIDIPAEFKRITRQLNAKTSKLFG